MPSLAYGNIEEVLQCLIRKKSPGHVNTVPQCNFSLEFPEILSRNHV